MNYPPSQTPADYTTNQPPAAVIAAATVTPPPPPSYTNPIPPPRHPSPYPSPRRPLFTQTPTPPPPSSTTNNISSATATVARFSNPNFTNPQQQQFNHRPYEDLFRPNGGFVNRLPPPRSQIHGQTQTVTVAGSSNPASAYPPPVRPPTISPSQGFQIHNRSSATFINQMQMLRPNYQQQQQEQQKLLQQQQRQQPPQQQHQQKRQQQHPKSGVNAVGTASVSAPIRGVPVYAQLPKVASSPSNFPATNGYKHLRGKRKDETVVTIRDRKVRITEGASLYALCRSWLRNGRHEDRQPVNEDSRMRLPRPIPAELIGSRLPTNSEVEEDKEDVEASEHLSSEELLRRHIQRAKKVRARLREERSRKIDRYRTRLSLLIPIHPDHQLEDDANS